MEVQRLRIRTARRRTSAAAGALILHCEIFAPGVFSMRI